MSVFRIGESQPKPVLATGILGTGVDPNSKHHQISTVLTIENQYTE